VGERVRVYEVGPRDGLQNEATPIPTATKARFIELLGRRLREIEATSFVAPRAIPQLATPTSCLATSSAPRRPLSRSSSRTRAASTAPRPPASTRSPSSPPRPTRSRRRTSG
jgi:isopropylmalate/homocitrate/citramalate synthase